MVLLRRIHLKKKVIIFKIIKGHINYEDFIWFCLSEEDKTTNTSIEYCFRILDCDSDGIISNYEMELFFNQQLNEYSEFYDDNISFNEIINLMYLILLNLKKRNN